MWFFRTHACNATWAVLLAVVLLVWPPAVAWMAASVALGFALREFRASFAAIDGPAGTRRLRIPEERSSDVDVAAALQSLREGKPAPVPVLAAEIACHPVTRP